jgi:ribosome-binding factor A
MLHSRMKRVEQEIQQELARILAYEMRDPRIQMVTPTHVSVSKDLREATVHVSFLNDDPESAEEAMNALEAGKGYIKRLLASRIVIKRLPDLHFRLDTSIGEAFELYKVLDKAVENDEHRMTNDEQGASEENGK